MKRNIYWVMIIILAIMPCAMGTTVITNVQISPAQPSFFDIITIASYGSFSGGTNWYDKSEFTTDEQSLYLNLYFIGGFGPQITQPWSHNDVIGTLPQGNYDLSVQAYWRVSGGANYILHDNYSISFEVIPEPATIALFCLSWMLINACSNGKRILIMKKCAFVSFLILLAPLYAGPIVNISDVQISPENPSFLDLITIETDGYIPSGAIRFDESVLSINGYSLQLDIYFTDRIGSTIPKNWFHNVEIGSLSQGNYDLLVQAYWRSSSSGNYILHDDFVTHFAVVPEPVTISLLFLGFVIINRRR